MKDNNLRRKYAELANLGSVEKPAGIFRTTLSFNDQSMLCHFQLTRGSVIPLHNHEAVQHGYVLNGSLRFLLNDGKSFTATAGSSYAFDPWEHHGAEAIEDSEVLEFFTPMRPEYADNG
jgi:quercetin dioxygenase-like cupin family protein